MATLTPQFDRLLEADQKDIFFKNFTMRELLFPQLFQRRPSTKAYEDRLRVAALGTFATKPEGTPVAFDDPVQGVQRRTVHQTYALGWRATEEVIEDDQHNVMSGMSADLGESARDHQERLAWGLLNDGYDGNTYTGLGGQSLFNTAHTLLRGGTASNELNPPVALSVTGLEAMMNLASLQTSEEGRFTTVDQQILLIHPSEQHNAYVLLNTEFRTGSSDNDRSTVQSSRSGLSPLVVPYKTSQTNWSVHAGSGSNSLVWNDRRQIRMDMANDSETFDRKFYGSYRASVMTSEWRGNWGSQF